jgi:hypothetical protein
MHNLDLASVPQWANIQNYWTPASVDTNCPYCAKLVNFTPTYQNYDPHRKTMACTATCPACFKAVYLWVVHPRAASDQTKRDAAGLLMYPAPRLPRQPVPGIELLPDRVRKAYYDALGVFNARVWGAATTCCRRSLETAAAHALPAGQATGPLRDQLQRLQQTVDWAQPLATLTHTLQPGTALAAHFELDREPDAATAEAILNLVESFLQYAYVLPALLAKLDQQLAPPR